MCCVNIVLRNNEVRMSIFCLQLLSKNDEQAMHVNVSLVHKLAQENQNEMKTLTQV